VTLCGAQKNLTRTRRFYHKAPQPKRTIYFVRAGPFLLSCSSTYRTSYPPPPAPLQGKEFKIERAYIIFFQIVVFLNNGLRLNSLFMSCLLICRDFFFLVFPIPRGHFEKTILPILLRGRFPGFFSEFLTLGLFSPKPPFRCLPRKRDNASDFQTEVRRNPLSIHKQQ